MKPVDVQFGQMALARGVLSVGQLIRCVGRAAGDKRELRDVLITEGLISNIEAKGIDALLCSDDAALQKELELGKTIVLEAIDNSRSDLDDMRTERFLTELELEPNNGRYVFKSALGKGGMGEVFEVLDHALRRNVALKRLREDADTVKNRQRLLLEAQVTGLLEHPSIVPVYDIRNDEDGNPFYIMRVVQEQSLHGVIKDLRKGESKFSLVQLVSVLRQVSLAVHYAHDKGVIHRDLKPENILIGKYGEVYVIDWGIAKIVREGIGLETTESGGDGLIGTPRYMSPEQARGESGLVDSRSDVYTLGTILYEILTLCPVFESDQILALLFKVVYDEPIAPTTRVPERNVPEVLEATTLRALQKDPAKRFQSAEDFAAELEAFLDGVKEAERKRELAKIAFEQALQVEATYIDVQNQQKELIRELTVERKTARGGTDHLWGLDQQVEDLSIEIERLFSDTINHYSQALVHEPWMPSAIEKIGAMYWIRFRDAERAGDKPTAAYFEGLVRQFNDGRYDELLAGSATLDLIARPKNSHLRLKSFHSVQRRLEAWDVLEIESGHLELSHGSYLLELAGENLTPMKIPFLIDRGESLSIELPEVFENTIPDDYIYIHKGPFRPYASTVDIVFVDSFAIQKYPVTVRQYLEFVNSIDSEEAETHVPRTANSSYFQCDEEGKYFLPVADEEGDAWEPDWPILAVNYYDAVAFAKWRSAKDGRNYRLPELMEWLKSARGVDGRVYPWGNTFDSSFCRMRDSEVGRSVPAPVGTYKIDRSPYGVFDLCGNIAEWTSSFEEGTQNRYLGGASYNSFSDMCKLDFTMSSSEEFKFGHYGIRLVLDLG